MADRVEIVEVGPRDGLQNEARTIPTTEKIALIDLLSQAGFARIEATSFVSPRWVPQMADADAVMAGIRRATGVRYGALTPNLQGYRAARAAGVDDVAIFAAASEAFSRANLNCTIAESLDRFRPLAQAARADGIGLRGYVSTVTHCPFSGAVAPGEVARVTAALFDLGCDEVSLGETLGRAHPDEVEAMLASVLMVAPATRLAGHFHDTAGRALANVDAALARGLRVFDAAAGGLGGCPYAPGAAGNVATESLAQHLQTRGHDTGLDPAILARAAVMAQEMRGERGSDV